jgi:hypothetical protein
MDKLLGESAPTSKYSPTNDSHALAQFVDVRFAEQFETNPISENCILEFEAIL